MLATLGSPSFASATAMTRIAERRDPRSPLQLHYQLVGLLVSAGDDGICIRDLARAMFPGRKAKPALLATRNLVQAAAMALPVHECDDERVGLDMVNLVIRLQRSYLIPVTAADGPDATEGESSGLA